MAALNVAWELLSKETLTLVALSGGLDSVCLCYLLCEAGYPVAAAHFNHRLRGEESDADERFVREFCKERNVPLFVGSGDVAAFAEEERIGTEEAARKLRYAFLERTARECDACCIATAHHANDNAETVLFNLARGTGSAGLAGIAARCGMLVRPLLGVTRAELLSYAHENGLAWCEDATNEDENYTRNFIRAQLLPRMEEVNAAAVQHIGEAAGRLREDEEFLTELAEARLSSLFESDGAVSLAGGDLLDAPAALRRRMLRAMLRRLGAGEKDFSAAHYCSLEELLRDRKRRTLDLPHGVRAVWDGGVLRLENAPQREGAVPLVMDGSVCRKGWRITLSREESDGALALDSGALPLSVDSWRAKDRLHLPGLPASRSVKRLLAERGVDATQRELLPVIRSGGTAAAVYGVGVDIAFSPRKDAVYITFQKT